MKWISNAKMARSVSIRVIVEFTHDSYQISLMQRWTQQKFMPIKLMCFAIRFDSHFCHYYSFFFFCRLRLYLFGFIFLSSSFTLLSPFLSGCLVLELSPSCYFSASSSLCFTHSYPSSHLTRIYSSPSICIESQIELNGNELYRHV